MITLSESSWGEEEHAAVANCLREDRLTMGPKVKVFESEFAKFVGAKHAIMVNSGSSANLLAAFVCRELNVDQKRNTVVVPALSWSTTYFPWIQAGYKLKFVDIDPLTLNIDVEKLRRSLTSDVIGICIPHILGADAGILEILELANEKDIFIVEDTCESLGAVPEQSNGENTMLGAFGMAGTYSFFRSHHISTMEGGMIVTNNDKFFQYAISMRAHGWLRELPRNNLISTSEQDPWEGNFKFYLPGFNLRPLEMSGAIGSEQLRKLPGFLVNRRWNASLLKSGLEHIPSLRLQNQTQNGSWMAFAVTVDSKRYSRKQILKQFEALGIETRPVVAGNFIQQPVMNRILSSCILEEKYPGAEYIHKNSFMFANHGRKMSEEISALLEDLSKI